MHIKKSSGQPVFTVLQFQQQQSPFILRNHGAAAGGGPSNEPPNPLAS